MLKMGLPFIYLYIYNYAALLEQTPAFHVKSMASGAMGVWQSCRAHPVIVYAQRTFKNIQAFMVFLAFKVNLVQGCVSAALGGKI